jgi:hypothetical protein
MIERFEQSQQIWRAQSSSIGIYDRINRDNSTTLPPPQHVFEEQGDTGDKTSRGSSGTLILAHESADTLENVENEMVEVAELFDDGSLVLHLPCDYDEAHTPPLAETGSESEAEDNDTPFDIGSSASADEAQGLELGGEWMLFNNETAKTSHSGRVFLDEAIDVASCKNSDLNAFLFCIHTLILHDEGKFTAMLREPCVLTRTACSHVSMYWHEESLHSVSLPALFDVIVRPGQVHTSANLTEQTQGVDDVILNFSLSGFDEDRHTLIYLCQGAHNRYAAPTSITIMQSRPASGRNDGSAEEEEARGNSEGESEAHQTEEEEAHGNSEGESEAHQTEEEKAVVRCGIRDYTAVPCYFCHSDALQPAVSAKGTWGVFVYHNDSIGYNCSRCNKRTWISGGEFTLTLAGGSWMTW